MRMGSRRAMSVKKEHQDREKIWEPTAWLEDPACNASRRGHGLSEALWGGAKGISPGPPSERARRPYEDPHARTRPLFFETLGVFFRCTGWRESPVLK
jgi:hypothetical protein